MTNTSNEKPIDERRSGDDRRKNKNPRRKENRNDPGKAKRRINKDRRKDH